MGTPNGTDISIIQVNKKANADRIAACVNALEGLNPAAIKGLVKAAEAIDHSPLCFCSYHNGNDCDPCRVREELANIKAVPNG